ncbi:class I SAM-dependent methyltransferase [Aurantimonas sp. VKM B-3413]|uniref:class I SAM-dependent methyltransferase n=1 Tax=Aurantimonas sp. VKM B-3413 TaxID=2779401 RepID=UPI001E4C9BF2|nr:methyltransferase domain-containing protein [Aurantimonas sp. VKM B-3413]MCB8837745.1 methyltransferase domain-containing protein [Aurantimonas sp. VKM B-3413]
MQTPQHAFTAEQYGIRAQDYVTSAVHAGGADLDQIETVVSGKAAARVLDLGCGGGHVSYRAAPHVAEVVACDVTARMLEAVAATAKERGLANISTLEAAAEALPLEDASFDFVLCRFTAHHWQDMEAGLREARRVLKAGGRAVFIDTVAPEDPVLDTHVQAVELLRDASHVRNYRTSEWVAALARSGFAVEELTTRRLRMDFPVWIARTRAPDANAAAIRGLQNVSPPAVNRHFSIEPDGSFHLDAVTFVVRPA